MRMWAKCQQDFTNASLLLEFGADPFVGDDCGRSAEVVELIALSAQEYRDRSIRNRLSPFLDYENYDLSHLSRIILGFRPLDLETELGKSEFGSLIDQKDETGLSPLHWAVRAGNSQAVQQLIQQGRTWRSLIPGKPHRCLELAPISQVHHVLKHSSKLVRM